MNHEQHEIPGCGDSARGFDLASLLEVSMSRFRTLAVVLGLAAASAAAMAQDVQHSPHHPAGPASAPPRHDIGTPGGVTAMVRMNAQMRAMQVMHEKITAAKTPAERDALMPEHMKLMQESMSMLRGMSPAKAKSGAGDPASRQEILERRVDMMESMMQMLVDGMPAPSTAPGR